MVLELACLPLVIGIRHWHHLVCHLSLNVLIFGKLLLLLVLVCIFSIYALEILAHSQKKGHQERYEIPIATLPFVVMVTGKVEQREKICV